jgi:hypothetical protein
MPKALEDLPFPDPVFTKTTPRLLSLLFMLGFILVLLMFGYHYIGGIVASKPHQFV